MSRSRGDYGLGTGKMCRLLWIVEACETGPVQRGSCCLRIWQLWAVACIPKPENNITLDGTCSSILTKPNIIWFFHPWTTLQIWKVPLRLGGRLCFVGVSANALYGEESVCSSVCLLVFLIWNPKFNNVLILQKVVNLYWKNEFILHWKK